MTEDVTPTRRSGRQTRPNTRYSNDAFEGQNFGSDSELEHELLGDGSESDGFSFDGDQRVDGNHVFDLAEDNDADSNGGGRDDEESDPSEAVDDIDETNGRNIETIPEDVKHLSRQSRFGTSARKTNTQKSNLHSQGVHYAGKNTAKHFMAAYTFGRTRNDVELFLRTVRKWFPQITLPSRQPDAEGVGGMEPSYFTPKNVSKPINDGALWFLHHQICDVVEPDATGKIDVNSTMHLIVGSVQEDRIISLSPSKPAPLQNLWKSGNEHKVDGDIPVPVSSARNGWILNVGKPVRCLDWAPNHDGSSQYLAVCTVSEDPGSSEDPVTDHKNAYVPSPSALDSIQIWHFKGLATSVSDFWTVDSSEEPSLTNVLSLNFGPVIDLRWCPNYQTSVQFDDSFEKNIGLLAVLTGDGTVRILNVPCPSSIGITEYQHYPVAAFTSCPPSTICTCLTWVSPTVLAAGCANGYVAAWDLERVVSSDKRAENAVPFLFQSIHNEYILTLTSCTPSRPNVIITTCAGGHMKVTNLRSPTTDQIAGLRSRLPIPTVAWHEQSQTAVSGDDFLCVRCSPIRQLERQIVFGRMSSPLTSLTGSLFHSSTLMGTANGSVSVINPLRKAAPTRDRESVFRQEWFRHEWRRRPQLMEKEDGPEEDSSDSWRQQTKAAAKVRLTTGFVIEDFSESSKPDTEERYEDRSYPFPSQVRLSRDIGKEEINPVTIYDEGGRVNSLRWNPNLCAGGWAAAGMGSGVVWIEDLCVDES
ncbi:MAG: hypothetical protein M1831_002636 [Alyxoria varia]|nr:MAG: hypothetical protein M1831_002636 [Alyxoria varia]